MATEARVHKVADLLQKLIAEALFREVKDPRVRLVNITSVEMARDLSFAKVFVAVLGDETKAEAALEGLTKAKGFIRHQIGKNSELRIVPELHFVLDRSAERAAHLSSLIDAAIAQDKKHS
ncbi:MAG: 30S ribosome-binding factor RbfA [Gammaproteobacteria bacterium]|nr:30S ribosome-binding factor RbfA [Gammaproteobacteria bacterium]